jgi:hypothetical protein
LPKGVYQHYTTIGSGEIRHYSRHYVRRVTYKINPTDDCVDALRALFPLDMKEICFSKGRPKVGFDEDTLIYIYLESKLFNNSSDGFTSRVANNTGEACSLIEAGFEYVTGEYDDGGKIFKKRN